MKINLVWILIVPAHFLGGCAIDRSIAIENGDPDKSVRIIDGEFDLYDGAHVASVRVVDGKIRLHEHSSVAKNVKLTDGLLEMEPDATVHRDVVTHYASVKMNNATLKGDLDTYCTGGELTGTKIQGTLIVRKRALWYVRCESKPVLIIGPGTEVAKLRVFTQDVDIQISDEAVVGDVQYRF